MNPYGVPYVEHDVEHARTVESFKTLRMLANQNGFTVHDVSSDGDCLHSAILCQLTSLGVCNASISELRLMVVNHLTSSKDHYIDFVVDAVASDSRYNADTEAPNEEYELIASVQDPEIRKQLKFDKYVRGVGNKAWGDNIVIQALCDMFSLTINVLTVNTQHANTLSVIPNSAEPV